MSNAKTHGDSRSRLYSIWRNIKTRCYNPNTHNYENYGGKGITLNKGWFDYVISEAETVQQFAKKNIELNEFLNEYSEERHWGKNVIDVAMDIITKQDKQIEELKDDKVELYKLNAKFGVKAWDIEQQNKRYCDGVKEISKLLEGRTDYILQNEVNEIIKEMEKIK